MNKITHIGLDVHKETIAVATLRSGALLCEERVIPNTPEALRRLVAHMGDPSALRACISRHHAATETRCLPKSSGAARSDVSLGFLTPG